MAVSQSLTVTQISQDIASNTSRVRILWTSTQSGDSFNNYTRTAYYYISVNGGTETEYSVSYTLPKSSTKTIVDATITVNHAADGTGSISVRTWMDTRISAGVIQKSQSLTLTTIPRATTPTIGTATMGSTVTINLPRASSSFTHNLTYVLGNASGTIATGAGASASWSVPLSLAAQLPNSTTGVGTLTCKTYNGSTLIGTKTISFRANVPSTLKPTVSAVSIAEATAGIAAQFAAYVQNKSTLSVSITAAGIQGSTISKYQTTILGVKYTGSSFTSQALNSSGSVSVAVTVTDSRGRTATKTETITVLAYFAPKINSLSAWRINTSGTADDEGTRVAVSMNFEIAEVGTRNNRTFSLQYKKSGDSSFTTFSSGTASWTYSGTQKFTSSPELSTNYAYVIRLTVTDYFGSVSMDVEVPTGFVIMDFRSTGKGMAIGKVSEKDRLEIDMDTDLTGAVRVYAPTSSAADGAYLRMVRLDGTVAAFLATSDEGNGLNLHLYQNGSWSGVVKITPDGAIVAKNLSYGTATI